MGLSRVMSNCDGSYLQVSPWICCPQVHSQGERDYKAELTRTPQVEYRPYTVETCVNCLSRPRLCLSSGPESVMETITEVFKLSTETPVTLILPFL